MRRSKRIRNSRRKVRRSSLSATTRLSHAPRYISTRGVKRQLRVAGHVEERLVALDVALEAGSLLRALLGVLHALARLVEPRLEVGAVEVLRLDRLLHEHEG